MSTPEEPDYSDHDPLAPMGAGAQASLLAAMASTAATHPDKEQIDRFVRRKQPLDLRPCRDA